MRLRALINNLLGRPPKQRQHWYSTTFGTEHQPLAGLLDAELEAAALRILSRNSLKLCARDYNLLPPELKRFFRRGRK